MFDKVLDAPPHFARIYPITTFDWYYQKAASAKNFP